MKSEKLYLLLICQNSGLVSPISLSLLLSLSHQYGCHCCYRCPTNLVVIIVIVVPPISLSLLLSLLSLSHQSCCSCWIMERKAILRLLGFSLRFPNHLNFSSSAHFSYVKNCERCPVSLFIVTSVWLKYFEVFNWQKCQHIHKCHKFLGLLFECILKMSWSGHGQVKSESSVSHWVCEWQGHLMSSSGQLKNNRKTFLTPYESDWFTEDYIFGLFCSTPQYILTTLNSEYNGIIIFSVSFILSIIHIEILVQIRIKQMFYFFRIQKSCCGVKIASIQLYQQSSGLDYQQ